MTASIVIEDLQKSFRRRSGYDVAAVDDVSLEVEQGEFVVLLGPSGCGKTTLLRCIAGLEQPDSGRIVIKDRLVFDSTSGVDVAVHHRQVGMVFQSYALWPHMTVARNVGYPLRAHKTPRRDIRARVTRVLESMRIAELAEQYPSQISGGQQQRVALARAIVAGGDVVLFDEPLSNIDARVRIDLRAEILAMQQELGFTAVYVTHDQEEAMALASRIAVLDQGRIVQCGSPEEIYHRPDSYHVAQFVGTINELAGVVSEIDGAQAVLETEIGAVRVAASPADAVGRTMVAVSRPERWQISATEPSTPNRWKGMVDDVHFVGSRVEYRVEVLGHQLRAWTFSPAVVDVGAHVWVSAAPEGLTLLAPPEPSADGGGPA